MRKMQIGVICKECGNKVVDALGRSFKYNENKRGPNTEPCGTPQN